MIALIFAAGIVSYAAVYSGAWGLVGHKLGTIDALSSGPATLTRHGAAFGAAAASAASALVPTPTPAPPPAPQRRRP